MREVLGGVARGGQRSECEPAEVDVLAVGEATHRERMVAGAGHEQLGAEGTELAGPGDEVSVQVRLHRVGNFQAAPVGFGQVAGRMAGRIDDEGAPIAHVDQVGGVAEPVVNERHRGGGGHAGLSPATTM
jgi:hypothetical protein